MGKRPGIASHQTPGGSVKIGHISLSKAYRGSEHQLLMLAKSLSNDDIEQYAMVRNPVLARRLAKHSNVSVGPLVNSPVTAFALMPIVDLAHAHDGKALQAGLLLNLTRSIPYVVTHRSMNPPPTHALARSMYRRAEGIICVSEAVSERMLEYCPDTPVESIYDACCTNKTCIPSTRQRRMQFDDEFVVGHVGELNDSTKGQGIILDVAEQLRDSHPHIRFVLVGQGRDENRLRERAARLPNVSFTGWLPNLQVIYETMDVFLFPSREEALGSAMLEAMSYHLPVVASNVGGIPEVLRHGHEGIVCGADDRRGYQDALLALLTDVNLRKRLGDGARARARLFSPQRMAAGYARIYRRVLDTQRVPALLI
jgi:glycosyltransferase involved in cell wall biosynthesis